ncbi:MAG: HDIG domain-containing protein [Anaerolineae bacterium]
MTHLRLPPFFRDERRWPVIRAVGLALALTLGLTAVMVAPNWASQVQLKEGDVSPTDIRAPRKVQYESLVATGDARAAVLKTVPQVYLPPDVRLTRQALKHATEVLDMIDWVRNSPSASADEKRAMLQGVAELKTLPPAVQTVTLSASDADWQVIRGETLRLLEAAMRQSIREDQVGDVRRLLPSLGNLAIRDDLASAASEYAGRFLQPNTLLDQAATDAARRAALASVPPTLRTIEKGETILRAGDIVQRSHLEALEKLDLLQQGPSSGVIFGTLLFVGLSVFCLGLYIAHRNPDFWVDWRRVTLAIVVIFSMVALAKLMIPGRTLMPYVYPGAAAAMLLAVLLEPRFGLATSILLAVMVSFIAGGSYDLLVYVLLGGVVASVSLWRVERLTAFMWAGVSVSLVQIGTVVGFRLIRGEYDALGLVELSLAAIASGVLATCLAAVGYYLLGNLFDLTTSLRLMELARPDQPILRELQLRAPGTYHHSLIVSNLAERAAHDIHADALLCRVAAYYHDIGKMKYPQLFIENQMDGVNPHDALEPEVSARFIISHVADGLAMGAQAKLPRSLLEVIGQHHGDTLVQFFYVRASQQAAASGGKVDEAMFRYPGPRPSTREAAVLMLADCCEAAVRAKRPSSPEDMKQIVRSVIQARLTEGQLGDSPLTLVEVEQVRKAFEAVLQGVYHVRVEYPQLGDESMSSGAEELASYGMTALPVLSTETGER